jgi:phage gpG-like protein
MNINVSIDKNDLKRLNSSFENIINGVNRSANKPLREAAEVVVSESLRNFNDQGFTYNQSWDPLKASTRRQRERLGFNGARPILVRTGKLKRGTRITKVSSSEAVIENKERIAPYHQYGTDRMVKRQILGVSDKGRVAIAVIISKFIASLIRR